METALNFSNAMQKIVDGAKVHKLEWEDKTYYAVREDGFLMLHKPDGQFHQWLISEADMLGTDYIVL